MAQRAPAEIEKRAFFVTFFLIFNFLVVGSDQVPMEAGSNDLDPKILVILQLAGHSSCKHR